MIVFSIPGWLAGSIGGLALAITVNLIAPPMRGMASAIVRRMIAIFCLIIGIIFVASVVTVH